MVRGLGVSHKSLFVPGVTEGTYAIQFEHADYLTKNFNISVGSGLPTTFTEGMTEKTYLFEIVPYYASGTRMLEDPTLIVGDTARVGFYVKNVGNTTTAGDYLLQCDGVWIADDTIGNLSPGASSTLITIPFDTGAYAHGNRHIELLLNSVLTPATDTLAETLALTEWTTDITFIATAPGITDLHGVEVFIDGTSMGTT